MVKNESELVAWMWKVYPDVPKSKKKDRENYLRRSAMLEAYKFLIGKVDEDERQREIIAKSIYDRIMKEHEIH
jgi:hypothetical protein